MENKFLGPRALREEREREKKNVNLIAAPQFISVGGFFHRCHIYESKRIPHTKSTAMNEIPAPHFLLRETIIKRDEGCLGNLNAIGM
jgi:hypothetical protein